ncbi:hypothetical protein [Chitinophaga japonensis]|uniref:hypothetical protein n=1 Tax=Chitinophaga japonensis TaxID=104662 RepID=UPI0011A17FB3|nr:hypothetical protein [Chitinophaga japonensis]
MQRIRPIFYAKGAENVSSSIENLLQKLCRHSHVTTTIGYQQNFIHKDADDALDAVINNKAKPKEQPEPQL